MFPTEKKNKKALFNRIFSIAGLSIGGAILDIDQPSIVKYRCENFLLTPEAPYEERGFVANVCFPCATLQDADTGRIALYYGCADSYVGLAFTTVDEVVDYINLLFMRFAVFNFADICVCVGVALWVLVIFLEELHEDTKKGPKEQ